MLGISDSGWVAIGTLALAGGTAVLAFVSWRGVKATFAEVASARQRVLTDVPVNHPVGGGPHSTGIPGDNRRVREAWELAVVGTSRGLEVSIPFRNIGPGPAVIQSVKLLADTNANAQADGWSTVRVLPTNESARANGVVPDGARRRFTARVNCVDVNGVQPGSTTFCLERYGDRDEWLLMGVEISGPGGAVSTGTTW